MDKFIHAVGKPHPYTVSIDRNRVGLAISIYIGEGS
jgi:hypothetical protein